MRTCVRHAMRMAAATLALMTQAVGADDLSEKWLPADPLSKQWWQLFLSVPNATRKDLGDGPAACGLGQNGRVWFLSTPGTPNETLTRHCTVPKGTKLFVPIVTAVCTPFPGETLADNIQLCRELIDPFNKLSLAIDGKKRNELIERRAHSRGFPAWFPEDNFFDSPEDDVPAGVYVSVAEGQYALIEGLRVGHHTIRARASSTIDPNVPSFDAIYQIDIVAATTVVPR